MSEEDKGFVIKDRRTFSEESDETQADIDAAKSEIAGEETAENASSGTSVGERQQQAPFPKINFSTFVASLNASVLLNLGAIEDPNTGKKTKNLPMAKQTIDILNMLEEKTSGNLSKDEENLLKNILYDLRLMFVKER